MEPNALEPLPESTLQFDDSRVQLNHHIDKRDGLCRKAIYSGEIAEYRWKRWVSAKGKKTRQRNGVRYMMLFTIEEENLLATLPEGLDTKQTLFELDRLYHLENDQEMQALVLQCKHKIEVIQDVDLD